MKDLRSDEVDKIKEEFLSCFSVDENIASLREEKNTALKDLSSYLGFKKTLISKVYRYWSKTRKGDEADLDEINDILNKLGDY